MLCRVAAALLAGVLVSGCGDSGETIIPAAGVSEITGPYRAEPYRAFDPAIIASVEAECRTANGGGLLIPPPAALVLADARGAGRLYLMFRGAKGETGECVGTMDAARRITIDGGGSGSGDDVPGPGPLEIGSS